MAERAAAGIDPRAVIRQSLALHPRVAGQALLGDSSARLRIAEALPPLVPFRDQYRDVMAILDWDHRLPSRTLALRIFAYYDEAAAERGRGAFSRRTTEIKRRDRFPEFDVPDFEGLPADEAYEADVTIEGAVDRCRLTSAWRRSVGDEQGRAAIATARHSPEFQNLRAELSGRPPQLGDLETVGWCPPCESNYPRWTLDVWYLTSFDGHIGKGRSLLVDPAENRVVAVREFVVRAG
jgi:hypothetical protein